MILLIKKYKIKATQMIYLSARIALGIIVLLGLQYCSSPNKTIETEAVALLEVPPSYFSFRVNITADELQQGLNDVMPMHIMDGAMPMKNDKDTLFLKVKRKGMLKLAVRKNELFVSLPLEVEAAIKKKVFGITMSNEDSPIAFEGVLRASTKFQFGDNWDMDLACSYLGFDIGSNVQFNILGLNFGLEKSITKALEEHSDELSDLICRGVNEAFDFHRIIEKVWIDLQNGKRIAHNPAKLFLYAQPLALSGKVIPIERDTVSIHLEYRTIVQISPIDKILNEVMPLPKRGTPLSTDTRIQAYPEVSLGFDQLSSFLKDQLANQVFEYSDYKISFSDVKVRRSADKLEIELTSKGDITGKFLIYGRPQLNKEGIFTLEDFSYKVIADEEWVEMADWAIHRVVEQLILEKATMDVSTFLDDLDSVVVAGLSKSKIAPKVKVNFEIFEVKSHKVFVSDQYLQWIFYVDGFTSLHLKKGVFDKKN
ncbi:MAG: hypothetical protein ACJA2C_001382 [Marinoscillum sp.]|jgi:hypothetical protein